MAIADQIQALQADKVAIADAITAKGGTVNSGDGFDDFATDIATIPTGSPGIPREVTAQGVYQIPKTDFTFSLPAGTKDLGPSVLYRAFYGRGQNSTYASSERGNPHLISVDLSSLESISSERALYEAFRGCANASGTLDLSKLKSISGEYSLWYAFFETGFSSIDFSELETITDAGQDAFGHMTNLTSVSFPKLKIIQQTNTSSILADMFSGCSNLTSVSFPELTTIKGDFALMNAFSSTKITSLSFPKLTTLEVSGNNSTYSPLHECCSSVNTITSASFPALVNIGRGGLYNAFRDRTSLTSIDLSNTETLSYGAMSAAFAGTRVTNFSMPKLTAAGQGSLQNVMSQNTALTQVNMPLLENIGESALYSAFYGCTSLQTISFPAIETLEENAVCQMCFYGCTTLTSVSFPALKRIGSKTNTSSNSALHFTQAFYNCNNLTTISFPELEEVYCSYNGSTGGTFYNNNKVQVFNFPKLSVIDKSPTYTYTSTAQDYIFSGCTSLTEIHFAAANQAAIEATSGYATKWGAPASCTIYFDL